MLDEECLLPHGTDSGFVALLEAHTQVRLTTYYRDRDYQRFARVLST